MKVINRDAEVKLIEKLSDIQEDSDRWVAVCFAFSRLLEHYRSEYQIKIAINLINDLVGENEGAVYLCDDSTIYVLTHNVTKALIDKMIFQLRYLFMDDPLAYTEEGEENSEFAAVYDLDRSWEDFMAISKGRLTQKLKRGKSQQRNLPQTSPAAKPASETKIASTQPAAPKQERAESESMRMLTPASLAGIERDLSNADLSRVTRRQPICAAVPDTMVRRVFDEMYINIGHLRSLLGVDVDLLSNRWLFKYLTQILDDRMLDMLQRSPTRYMDAPISLNLNVPTLLSNRFSEFDASIKPAVKVSIVIEIQLADVFNDMAGFLIAKDTVQKLGYRVCLDGVTDLSFTQIDRQKLGFDLVKLQWNAEVESESKSAQTKELSDAIRRCGVNRVILTRCDSRAAVEYGQSLGISLFQGRYLDKVMNPKATIEN